MVVTVGFLPLTAGGVDRALGMMAQLYAASLRFDPVRARAATQRLMADPAAGAIWLIEAGGQICGYLVLTVGYSLEFDGRYGLLDELFVEEPFRSRGIGTHALEFAEEWCLARRLKALRLEVARHNPRAQALYQRAGFETHHRDLMTKWLKAKPQVTIEPCDCGP